MLRVPSKWVHIGLPAVLAGVAATLLASIGLGTPSLWGDEVATLMSASRPLPDLMALLGNMDAVHGLYYLTMHAWIAAFGGSPFALRAPSALALGFAVAGVVVLVQRFHSRTVALGAGITLALLPGAFGFAAEARSYAGTVALAILILVVAESTTRSRRRGRWIALAVLTALGVVWFAYLALFAATVLGWLAWRRAASRSGLLASGLVALAVASPVLILAWQQRGQIAWIADAGVNGAAEVLVAAWFGWWPLAVLGWAALLWSLIATIRSRRWDSIECAVLMSTLLPLAILWGASVFAPVLSPRYLAMCLPGVAIVIALRVHALAQRARLTTVGAAVVLLAVASPALVAERLPTAHRGSDWAAVASFVEQHAEPGDGVVFDESGEPWFRPRLALRGYPEAFAATHDLTGRGLTTESVWDIDVAPLTPQALEGERRVWLIERRDLGAADAREALEHVGFQPVESTEFARTVVTLYRVP
ncbi:MAG TPA: glycosyltransferase family 39 protein [Microbacteriaceae bacterium]|nr:glycosyltransferase family 39 protein [Microbacteriaceae bacterium]